MSCHFDNIKSIILKKISDSDRIDICTAWFSSKDILKALEDKEGTVIVGVPDAYNKSGGAFIESWYTQIQEYLGRNRFRVCVGKKDEGIVHHKFLIFYQEDKAYCVITGSYNLTEAAENNRENIVVIYDESIVNEYVKEFDVIKSISRVIN